MRIRPLYRIGFLTVLASASGLVAAEGTRVDLLGLGLAALVGLILGVVLASMRGLVVAVGFLSAFGAGVQSVWTDDPADARLAVGLLVAGTLVGRAVVWVGLRAGVARRRQFAVWLVGLVVFLRLATFVWGDAESGRLDLPGLPSFMPGELGRGLAVIAAGLGLAGVEAVRRQAAVGVVSRRGAWVPVLFALAAPLLLCVVMMVTGDLGPAVVLAATLAAITWIALGGWLALPPLAVAALGVAFIGVSTSEWQVRWQAVQAPRADLQSQSQLARALRAMGESGLVGGGPGSSALARTVPMGQSDYALATIAADYGLLAAVALTTATVLLFMLLLRRAQSMSGQAGLIAVGATWMLALTTIWVGLGSLGLIPFTGINMPLLAMSGSAALACGILLGAYAQATQTGDEALELPAGAGLRLSTWALASLALVAMAFQAVHIELTAGGGRLPGETLLRPRGELLYRDGTVLAASPDSDTRSYVDATLATELGSYDPAQMTQSGLELTAAGASTCGTHRSWWSRALTLGMKDTCDPANVVTSIDPAVQHALQSVTSARPGAAGIILDRENGRILAVSHGAEAVLNDGEPLPVFTDRSAPGSVFKMVVAAAAPEGLTAPALGSQLELPGGGLLPNDWVGACPGNDVTSMLAYSCNTVAGWLAMDLGVEAVQHSAQQLGLNAPALVGPNDPSLGPEPLEWGSPDGTTGLNIAENATQAGVAGTGIGQQGVRASIADIARMTSTVWSGHRRALTAVAGVCRGDEFVAWDNPAEDPVGVDLGQVQDGMQKAVTEGSLTSLTTSGVIAGKTGTAQNDTEIISWVTLVTEECIITLRVLPTAQFPHPRTGTGGAVDAAQDLLQAMPAGALPITDCR